LNRSNSQHFFNYRIAALYTKEEQLISVRGHARIIKALKAHDGDAADRAAREHVLDALDVTLLKLR
jgi:DNA-binding GntR family transcriptional regulator